MGKKDQRLTKEHLTRLRLARRSWDEIVSAYYYFGGDDSDKMGYRSTAKLFKLPVTTVRAVVHRMPKSDPEVVRAAQRFGWLTIPGLNESSGQRVKRMEQLQQLFDGDKR